jgi:multiple sugar transport system substrate-binding protein
MRGSSVIITPGIIVYKKLQQSKVHQPSMSVDYNDIQIDHMSMKKTEKESNCESWNYRLVTELVICFVLCFFLLLAGCQDTLYIPFLSQPTSPTSANVAINPTITPSIQTQSSTQTAVTPTISPVIKLWVPPLFDPASDTGSGRLLKARIQEFSSSHPGVSIMVRVKAPTGPGGMIDSLSATSAAVPDAMPSLVLLSRSNLEAAALKGLIVPLKGLTTAMDDSDWYPYAKQLSSLQDSQFGLPFAGDALLLMYRPGILNTSPTDWEIILRQHSPALFPASDPIAGLTLDLYLSDDGRVMNDQQQPSIDVDKLTQVLNLYSNGVVQGVFPIWMTQYSTYDQVWQAYRENRVCCMVTWASQYLRELPADSQAVSLPSLGEEGFTLADGWMWALSDPDPAHREMSVKLAEFLVDSDFIAEWSISAGYLPPRPSALAMWQNYSLQSLLNEVSLGAQIFPTNEITTSLGAVLKESTIEILQQKSDPSKAAQTAADQIIKAEE